MSEQLRERGGGAGEEASSVDNGFILAPLRDRNEPGDLCYLSLDLNLFLTFIYFMCVHTYRISELGGKCPYHLTISYP